MMAGGVVLLVFAAVYLGMMLGRLPGLALDRTGIALLGALALIAGEAVTPQDAWLAIDVPTMGLLFGLMIVSAQIHLGGFYDAVTRRVASAPLAPRWLLAAVLGVVAPLSALVTNDIVCLAMAPPLIAGCARRGLNPVPYLLGLACAANVGSAATLIGNPQNMLIGQALAVPFGRYSLEALPVTLAGLAVVWAVIAWQYRNAWTGHTAVPPVDAVPFKRWQSGKGLVAIAVIVACFASAPVPREVVALAAAGILLVSRSTRSQRLIGLVDWPLLVLFAGLFVVNHAFAAHGYLEQCRDALTQWGFAIERPAGLFAASVVLSNLVSNVPATMMLLPVATHPQAALILALGSTLAGNLIVVGSIANIIVVEQAARAGIALGWREHARTGVPVTLITLALAAGWIALLAR